MKPNFALSFQDDGITLLHRVSNGWNSVGDVSLDDPDMDAAIARLHSTATSLATAGVSTKLAIPNSQILYRQIPDPGKSKSKRIKAIESALVGATPYELNELVYDWHVTDGQIQIAVVARDTLREAEDFTTQHRFNPLSFVAVPDADAFEIEPFFGRTTCADRLIGKGTEVDRDTDILSTQPVKSVQTPPQAPAAPKVAAPAEPSVTVAPETASKPDDAAQADDAKNTSAADVDTPEQSPEDVSKTTDAAKTPAPTSPSAPAPSSPPKTDEKHPDPAPKLSEDKATQRVTAQAIPDESEQLALDAAQERQVDHPHVAITAGIVPPDEPPKPPKPAPKPPKSEPLPEPPAMPAAVVPPRRPEAPQTLPTPDQSRLIAGAPTAARLKAKTDPFPLDHTEAEKKGAVTPSAALSKLGQTGLVVFSALKNRSAEKAAKLQTAAQEKMRATSASKAPIANTKPAVAAPKPASAVSKPLAASRTIAPPEAPKSDVFGGFVAPTKTAMSPTKIGALAAAVGVIALAGLWAMRSPDTPQPTETAQIEAAPEDSASAPLAPVPTPEPQTVEALETPTVTAPELAADLAPADPPITFNDAPIDLEELNQQYAATGVWPIAPPAGTAGAEETIGDLYIASIDPKIQSQDAVALPNSLPRHIDSVPRPTARPAPAGTTFDFDARGLVRATPDGALTPSGVRVFAGTPPVIPSLRPEVDATTAAPDAEVVPDPLRALLAEYAPRLRPDGLIEQNEQANLGGLTYAELGGFRPTLRPVSEQQTAQAEAQASGEAAPAATAPIVTASLIPEARPKNIAKLAAAAKAAEAAAAAAAPSTAGTTTNNAAAARVTAAVPATKIPSGPTKTTVARAATVENAINLRKVNLMGVYGSNSDRRALVRLPSGRLTKVKVGDRVDGGLVQSISSSSLIYIKNGKSRTLKVGG